MSGHTPGPWVAVQIDPQEWRLDAPAGDPGLGFCSWHGFAVTYGCEDSPRDGAIAAAANARLIAAAPDMLAVLQDLRDSAAYWSEYDVPIGIVERINAAIAKATGGQP